MLNLIKMIECVDSVLLLTLLEIIYHIYHKCKIVSRTINIVKDSIILDQLNNLEKDVDSEVIKTKRGRRKKIDTKPSEINDKDTNDIIEKRDRLIACVLSGKNTH